MANPTAGRRVGLEVKAIISSLTTDANGSAGDLLVPMRAPMVDPVVRRMTVPAFYRVVAVTNSRHGRNSAARIS